MLSAGIFCQRANIDVFADTKGFDDRRYDGCGSFTYSGRFFAAGWFLIVTVGLMVINFVVGNIIEPAYMGRSLNLSPLMILLSLSIWGSIWGLTGMFLAVPLMVVTAIICAHFKGLRWLSVLLSADGRIDDTGR